MNRSDGEVEVLFFGHWIPVCSMYWDLRDATVVCHQLGYTAAKTIYYRREEFGLQSSMLSLFECTGYETNLTQCGHSLVFGYCYSRYAGVTCFGNDTP